MNRLSARTAAGITAVLMIAGLLVAATSSPARATAPPAAVATPDDGTAPSGGDVVTGEESEMSTSDALILGVVEGITEYLPISSTGHLVVAERLLGLSDDDTPEATKTALDAYTVIIQFGAIIAVLVIYRKRVWQIIQGLIGRSADGRNLLFCLIAAFVPAAVIGLALGDTIDKHLLKVAPVSIAWIVGGIVIIALASRLRPGAAGGRALEQMSVKTALFIGCAQALALWPGTSRSLVTIVAAVLLGMSLAAAVEFSFLLGLLTLTAASVLSALKDGSTVTDTYGTKAPLIGIIAAGIAAAFAVKTFVAYLSKRPLTGFGWYRIAAGVLAIILLASNTI